MQPLSTIDLLSTELFQLHYKNASRKKRLELSYLRARAIAKYWALTLDDVVRVSPKSQRAHMDGIIVRDPVAHINLSIQYNLVVGTLATYVKKRPDLEPLIREFLEFDICGAFMLNEVGHGCDARNLETTASWESDGGFNLNTPNRNAAKFMPPSMPMAGIPRVALVMARLLVEGEDRGIRPFVVPINDGYRMCQGVKSWQVLLPPIGCGEMLDHSLTTFDNVRLEASAMLGDLVKPGNLRAQFLFAIGQLRLGSLALSLWTIPFLKCAAFIAGKYSQQRTVQEGVQGERVPILSFRTQQLPIARALAHVAVMEPLVEWVVSQQNNSSLGIMSRHALSAALKSLFVFNGQESLSALVERSGAQGMFPENQMANVESLTRCTSIAEGELLVLCIRHATEILLERCEIPEAENPTSLLAKHESGLIAELRELLKTFKGHRSPEYNKFILPRCRPMMLAIGQRMAFEIAAKRGVDGDLLAMYESEAVRSDSSWYVECLELSRAAQYEMESTACDAVMSQLNRHLDDLGIEPYCTAPMLSGAKWDDFINVARTFTAKADGRAAVFHPRL
ncbi:acyl-CoA oxidase [Aspergillus violaceofuscus CBS 115571]|uniref:Acyl-CoA oxidase n=1 Tax=Aspergillus violaceofuscus (strain CBS 115571) TaxID=1450538 RepID=A0A2V5HS30_ASPV1|nr:acyl-CoA oxidase [Aspergillus violaceofuscus CBS 115571]